MNANSLAATSRPGDNFGGGILRMPRRKLHGRARVRGDWDIECYAPIRVSDPALAQRILGRYGIEFAKPPEILHAHSIDKLLAHLRRPDIVALERVLSGGGLAWQEKYSNLVVNEGLNHLLDSTVAGQTQITTWYVLLKNNGTIAAADTPASHGGWTENTTYSESVRQTWTPNGAASSQSVTNSSSKATFSINGSTTIYGAALISNSTKGGTTGKFYAVGDFASSRAVISGDSLLVTATFTTADDGV